VNLSSWIAGRRRRARAKSESGSAPTPVRVLFLFAESYLNSPWSVIAMILRYGAANGIVPLVVLGHHTDGVLDLGPDIEVLRVQLGGRLNARAVLELKKLVIDREIDLIHVVDSIPSMLTGTLLSVASRTPLVVHFHSIPRLWSPQKRVILRTVASLAGAIVGVSKFVRDGIEAQIGIPARVLTWVHNGVDIGYFSPTVDGSAMRAFLGFKEGAIAVVEPARFWLLKGQKDLVRAVALARRQNPAIELALIGWNDTSYVGPAASFRAEIEELAASLGVSDFVRCFDPDRRANEIHAAADIVCVPSTEEPFGLVAIEAQATGRPFVGARSGAVPEMIDDGVDGILVEPNSPEAIAAALLRLAADPSLRAALGSKGRIRVTENFQDTLVASRFAAVYRAILASSPLP
jgi:glycosyltransferase involved in cell wall biosynthesis